MRRLVFTALAILYTLAGAGALVIGFLIPADDPLAPAWALLLGMPWTLLLSATNAWIADSEVGNAVLLAGAIALNAALLWWWALRRPPRRSAGSA